jgi:Putative adhesin
MKLRATLVLLTLIFSSAVLVRADRPDEKHPGTRIERKVSTDSFVSVVACVSSGSIKVNGWDRNEVRVRSVEATDIELKRKDEGAGPARKIEVRVIEKDDEANHNDPCEAYSDIELDVPRGATVQLHTRDSDVDVADVAFVFVNTQNGDINIENASRIVDAGTIGGGISLKESSGRVSLHSAGGSIEAINVKPAENNDSFEARSLGGEISLDHVSHALLAARTLNGSLSVRGPLAHNGRYNLRTMSGDLTLTLPEESSFQLIASYSHNAEIITDFPIILTQYNTQPMPAPKPAPAAPPAVSPAPALPPLPNNDSTEMPVKVKTRKGAVVVEMSGLAMRRIEGVHGSGDAKLELASFSGTIHLQKQ